MICVALQEPTVETCLQQAGRAQLAEIRIDLSLFNEAQIGRIFSQAPCPLIATCRPDELGPQRQQELLFAAIEAGAAYIDVEIEATSEHKQRLADKARQHGCKLIISYHNYQETPEDEVLNAILDQCFAEGADIAKIAALAQNPQDSARLLSLYRRGQPLVVLGMGEAGMVTRVAAPLLGAPFTFAAVSIERATAPGQLAQSSMLKMYELMKVKI